METPNPFDAPVQPVALCDIGEDSLTAFALDPPPKALAASIADLGVTHPVLLSPTDGRYAVVCGHRRVAVARALNHTTLPARVMAHALTDADRLAINLQENRGHRTYSDIECGRILLALEQAGVPPETRVQVHLPLLGRERSRKLSQDYLQSATDLPETLQRLLHSLHCPLRVYGLVKGWEPDSLAALEDLLAILKPGVNKCRELMEWADEAARRDACAPGDILREPALQTPLNNADLSPHDRYEAVRSALHRRRFPTLSDLQEQVWRAIDQLKLDDRIKLRVPENFESDRFKIELRFASAEELQRLAEQLFRASDAKALQDLLKIFKNLS